MPDREYFIAKTIPELRGYKIIEYVGSGCNAHVFKAHSEDANNILACKIIPNENLIGKENNPPLWRQEIDKANILKSTIVVKFIHVKEWVDVPNGINCMALCSEFVNGETMEKYISSHKKDISISFCELFLKNILTLIYDMEKSKIKHGDMHAKNVIVEDRSDQLGGPPFAFRVTDFGVAGATSDSAFKEDYDQLANVLRMLLENVDYQLAVSRDKFVFNYLNDQFLGHLLEKDISRDPLSRRTRDLWEGLDKIDSEFNKYGRAVGLTSLITPFDYLSCEQLGEAHGLLKALYSDLFLGLSEIEGRNNLVLTGPRGCGKSTVFKSLSLRHRIMTGEDGPEKINYIGIYYRCLDLYSAFSRYSQPDKEDAYNVPMHYINSTLICEVLEIVEMWASERYKEEFAKKESSISNALWDLLDLEKPNTPGLYTFKAICFKLQKERKRAAEKQRFINVPVEKIGFYFPPHILIRACEILMSSLSFLENKPFYFFIDDYSMPKISNDLQENLNRLFMQRSACSFFKLSTESPVSYVRGDIDGKSYVEGREFELLNLGVVYLTADAEKRLHFIEDVFSRRFHAVENYLVKTLEELIGDYNSPSENEIALAIRNNEKPEMWGKQNLCELCSGDIFYIISLVGKMVSKTTGDKDLKNITTLPKIDKNIQRDTIRSEAGNFLNSLRGIENGEHLVEVVTAFGNVAYSYLKFRQSKNEKSNPPHLASRIEPYEELKLTESAQKVYNELLRYSIFIEDPRGKSRRGKVVPRLYLRRSLVPHFKLTFSKRDSIGLEPAEIEQLLLEPKRFEKEQAITSEERKENKEQIKFDKLLDEAS